MYAGFEDMLYAINPDGTKKWEVLTGHLMNTPCVGSDGTVYVRNERSDLYAISPEGQKRWRKEYVAMFGPVIDATGSLYLDGVHGVKRVTPQGDLAGEIDVPQDWLPKGLAIGDDHILRLFHSKGTIYLIDCEASSPDVNSTYKAAH